MASKAIRRLNSKDEAALVGTGMVMMTSGKSSLLMRAGMSMERERTLFPLFKDKIALWYMSVPQKTHPCFSHAFAVAPVQSAAENFEEHGPRDESYAFIDGPDAPRASHPEMTTHLARKKPSDPRLTQVSFL
jgi:hypothetical protein